MSKLVLSDVTNINSITTINANFEKIQEELQEKVLYRDNPDGEPNHVLDNLDMNGNKIINAGEVRVGSLVINGVPVEPTTGVTAASAFQVYEYTATEGQTVFSVAPHTPFVSSLQVEVNGLSYPPSGYDVSGTDVIIPSASAGDEVVIRRFVNAPTTIPTAEDITFIQNGAGAIPRTMREKAGETVSVKDFGAKGDGVTDDATAIQAAVNSLGAGGGVVYFPPGVYLMGSTITINGASSSNVVLRGIGYSGSWTSSTLGSSIKISSSLIDGFSFSNYAYNCTVEGLHIFGGKRGIHFSQCLGWHVIECNLRQNVTGLECFGNGVGIVRDSMIRDNTTAGIYLAQSSGDSVITGCDIGGNGVNIICSTGNTHITDNAIFSSKNSGNGCGVLVDATQPSADSTIRNCVISGNLIANNDVQIIVKGTSLAAPNVQDIHIHSNHIHQADDGGEGFDSGFAYGQGVLVQFAKRVHIHHNNIIGCRDYGVKAVSCLTGVFLDHNYIRNGNAAGVVFDLVQWGRIDNNEFTSNVGTAIQMTCTTGGNFTQNCRIHGNSFQSNGAIYTEDAATQANFVYDNLGGNIAAYSLNSAASAKTQLRHIIQGGNQETLSNQVFAANISPLSDGLALQGGKIFQGSGAPSNANGNNGDVYLRTDTPGTVNQRIYFKSAGSWSGVL